MSYLIIHHFEEMWAEGLKRYNTNLDNEYHKIIDFIDNHESELDGVIMSFFDDSIPEELQIKIHNFCNDKNIIFKRYEYGYGWVKEEYSYSPEIISESNKGITWCDATRKYYKPEDGHILEIDDWQRELKNKHVYLAGAFEGECLDDMFTVLKTVGADVEFVKGLCVGQDDEYAFSYNGTTYDDMRLKLHTEINKTEIAIKNNEDFSTELENLKMFFIDNKRYIESNFYHEWNGDNDNLYEYLSNFISYDFDDTELNEEELIFREEEIYTM